MSQGKERCAAYEHGKQCRATKNLMSFVTPTHQYVRPLYILPPAVIAALCPRHRRPNEDEPKPKLEGK